MVNRIPALFEKTSAEKRAAFIAYICAGDPNAESSLAASKALIDAGVDMIEFGVPFSDPLADGLNHPANLPAIGAALAKELGMESDELAELTCSNAKACFQL